MYFQDLAAVITINSNTTLLTLGFLGRLGIQYSPQNSGKEKNIQCIFTLLNTLEY